MTLDKSGPARDSQVEKRPKADATVPATTGPVTTPGAPTRDAVTGLQRSAGNSATAVYVQMLGSSTKTVYDELVSASRGGFFGNVDEDKCLTLLARLRGPDLDRAMWDNALLGRLADAFNADEMVRMCSLLPFSLAQKLFWCDRAGELDKVGPEFLRGWFSLAPRNHVLDLMNRQSIFDRVRDRLPVPPSSLVGAAFPGPAILDLYGSTIAAARWLGRSTPSQVIEGIAPDGAPPAKVLAAKQRLVEANLWSTVKSGLPRGGALAGSTKAAMLRLVTADNSEAALLFPVRFDKPLTGSWNALDVLGVWRQLDTLPEQDVSANTVLAAFQAIQGDAGFWSGGNTVQLGAGLRTSTMGPERLPHTVRHEIGHAVHDMLAPTVNAWLRQGVGFWFHSGGVAGIQQVIADFGGWPTTYLDEHSAPQPFGPVEQTLVTNMLANHINSSSWTAKTQLPVAPTRMPAGVAGPAAAPVSQISLLWDAMPPALRQCFEGSRSHWYNQYTTHPRGANGFTFWNHWYSKPYYFSPVAKAAIAATGDNYSAMSEKEFFANCYAEYFEDPAGAQDPSKWGGSLSGDVKSFFREHIVGRQPYVYAPTAGAGASPPPVPSSPNQVPKP